MPIYRETVTTKAGKKEKRFRFEFDRSINGERVRLTKRLPKGTTQSAADAYDRQESARLYAASTGTGQRSSPTIVEAVALYLEEKGCQLANLNKVKREFDLMEPVYDGYTIDGLEDAAAELIQKYRKEKKSEGTINTRLSILRAACRYMAKRSKLPVPGQHLEIPAANNERQVYIDRRQMLMLCRHVQDLRARAIIRIAFYSGMRKMEIFNSLVVDDCFVITEKMSKNDEPRLVPIHPRVRTAVKYRSMIAPWKAYEWFKYARAQVGLSHLHFHDLRHSTASALINEAGADLYTVSQILGQKDLKSTKRYSHLATAKLKEALFKIGQKTPTRPHLSVVKKAA